MKRINKYFAIFLFAVLLSANISYADNDDSPCKCIKNIKNDIKQAEALPDTDISSLISLYNLLFETQKNENLYNDAAQTALILENLKAENYGEYSNEVFEAKMETLNLYAEMNNEVQRKAKLDELEKFSAGISDEQKTAYYNALQEYYANYEDEDKSNEILLKIYNMPSLTLQDKIEVTRKLSENYSYLRDIKNTNKFLDEYFKLVSEEENPYGMLDSYYMRKIYLNNDIENLYKDFIPLYEETKNNIFLADDEDTKVRLNHLNLYLANYYLAVGEFEKAKTVIDGFEKTNDCDAGRQKGLYEQYYDKIKDYSARKAVIKSIIRDLKKNGNSTYQDKIAVNEKYASYYKDINKYDKAEKLNLDCIDLINKYSNGNPARKYGFYAELAQISLDKGEPDNALRYAELANNTYKHKINSFPYASMLRLKADIMLRKNLCDEALEYLLAAEKIQTAVPTCDDLADTYNCLACLYAAKGNLEYALKYIDKVISIRELQYGKDNVNFYGSLSDKSNLLADSGQEEEATEIRNNILSDFENGKIQGVDYDFYFDMNIKLAQKYLNEEQYEKSIQYANAALKYASCDCQYEETYNILSDIYASQGRTALKLKYKALAKKA